MYILYYEDKVKGEQKIECEDYIELCTLLIHLDKKDAIKGEIFVD